MRGVAFAAAFAACVGVCGVANATDLFTPTPEPEYAQPAALWTGFYFGGHAGWSWGSTDVHDVFDYKGDPIADNSVDTSGVIAGVQVGYNFRNGNFVYGVEADLGYLDLSGKGSFDLPNPKPSDRTGDISSTYSLSGGLYGDLTARFGYATDKTLLYVKGGAAFVNTDFNSHYVGQNCSTVGHGCGPSNPSVFDFSNNETLFGWTIGVGVEYALTSSLFLKLEYQHFDFGSGSFGYDGRYTFNDKGYTSKLEGDVTYSPTVDAVKLGVNYQLDGGGESLK
jgi:outer membrane immunogenic protein